MPRFPASYCTVARLGLIDYGAALELQRTHVERCRRDGRPTLLLLEHPAVYTLGARGDFANILASAALLRTLGATIYRVDRGGDVTFHGPGQLVGYPIIDLAHWGRGPLWYVRSLEAVLIQTLEVFGIVGQRRPGRPGVYVQDKKIASVGVHVSRGVTSHGFALNVHTDLSYFSHINPCGQAKLPVTSMAEQGCDHVSMNEVMDAVSRAFGHVFGLAIDQGNTVPRAELMELFAAS